MRAAGGGGGLWWEGLVVEVRVVEVRRRGSNGGQQHAINRTLSTHSLRSLPDTHSFPAPSSLTPLLCHACPVPCLPCAMPALPALQEPNFHATYVSLVDKWGERELRDMLVGTTVHYIKVMLGSGKLKSITSERTLLKNLGAWLGKLTLANNRPVLQVRGRPGVRGGRACVVWWAGWAGAAACLTFACVLVCLAPVTSSTPLLAISAHPSLPCSPPWFPPPQKHLDIKAIILQAYEQGKMLAVLSWVRMLLEPAMDSRVFRPPNPWVMAILALLVEIYNLDNIKTGLKFEVGAAGGWVGGWVGEAVWADGWARQPLGVLGLGSCLTVVVSLLCCFLAPGCRPAPCC